ncbi:MAG: hypothetical protein ACKPKO_34945, partial [Candidatus Fonsibacter sp.]
PSEEITCQPRTNTNYNNSTCWYDWSRDCAVQIPKLGSSELTSESLCTLFNGCRVYIFGDESTWTTHDFKCNGDNEDMSSGDDGEEKE